MTTNDVYTAFLTEQLKKQYHHMVHLVAVLEL